MMPLAHGKTVRDYGEFTTTRKAWKTPAHKGALDFLACYHDFVSGSNAIAYHCGPNVASLRPLRGHEHSGLGPGCAGCFPRRAVHQGVETI